MWCVLFSTCLGIYQRKHIEKRYVQKLFQGASCCFKKVGKSASCIYLDLFGLRPILKGHGQLCDRADLDTTFASLKSVYHNPKSNLRVGYILKSASILPSISFDPRSFTENLFRSKLLLILLHYLIINKIKTVFKGT